MARKKMIPPDGGWGWVIVIAYALNNVIMIPMLQGFTLVLKDAFREKDIDATNGAVIISVNAAFGMAVGLIHGPLLQNFGYRKISLVGSMMYTSGIILTAFATTSIQFMVTYGLMASLGVGLTMSAFSLAVNTYFDKKRGRAMGLAMTVTGLGPILMPQLLSYLLYVYTTQGTILILGALTLHSIAATMLLQPIKWHATWQVEEPTNEETNVEKDLGADVVKHEIVINDIHNKMMTVTTESEGSPEESLLTNIEQSEIKTNGDARRRTTSNPNSPNASDSEDRVVPYKWWSSGKSLETVNLGSSKMIFNENITFGPLVIEDDHESETKSLRDDDSNSGKKARLAVEEKLMESEVQETSTTPKEWNQKKGSGSCCSRIVEFFDFNLLRDPIYVNMMLGMAIAIFGEINFAVHTPFILEDMGFSNNEIASAMSTVAGVDLVSRGLAPFVGEWLRLPARHMALISLIILIVHRSLLMFTSSFVMVLMIAIGLGFGKGLRSVNMALVIPNYIPIERLASATGIQSAFNGIFLMAGGPLLGWSRDKFGSYVPCLLFINSTTALTVIMWAAEMFIVSAIEVISRVLHTISTEARRCIDAITRRHETHRSTIT